MSEETNGMDLKDFTISQLAHDISELKKSDAEQNKRLEQLEINDKLQDRDITHLSRSLDEINENTKWLRRMFTKTLVSGAFGIGFTIIAGLVVWYLTTR